MRKYGFIQEQDEDDEAFNLKVLSGTFNQTVRDLFESRCSSCTCLDRFECIINPKCTVCCRARRISEDGVAFTWRIEAWLERKDGRYGCGTLFGDNLDDGG
ncbi:MAG: hypothetical protein KKF41_06295 [Actinobacteria bacterium]|nr:hypothetical protein [Actinomycetota bacterium]MBU1942054.1 hypothetical protein [Actinomycetota bacterium]MBU2687175.1 hypothetical protein [Actinomycetota bacterium]